MANYKFDWSEFTKEDFVDYNAPNLLRENAEAPLHIW